MRSRGQEVGKQLASYYRCDLWPDDWLLSS